MMDQLNIVLLNKQPFQ